MTASTLRSLDGLDIVSADFYLEFDDSTSWSAPALSKIIEELPFRSRVFGFRLDSFARWAEASREIASIESDQIMLFTNEDHVRFSPDISEYKHSIELVAELQKTHPSIVIMLPLSHFPEAHAMIPISQMTRTGLKLNGAPLVPCQIPAGPIVIGKKQFGDIWDVDFTGGMPIVGLENPRGPSLRLANGYYLPPRRELFRHLDSYGHVRVSNWPFNVLHPNVRILRERKSPESMSKYQLTTNLRAPAGGLNMTVASEEPGKPSLDSMRMSILKSSFIRPSFSSLWWVSSSYPFTKAVSLKSFLVVLMNHPEFGARAMLAILSLPIHLLLAVLGLFVRPSSRIRIHYIWFLTYGSSIGYLRLAYLALKNKGVRK